MANVIDELVISIGLDPSKLNQGISQVGEVLNAVNNEVKDFGAGLSQGLNEAESGLAQTEAAAVEAGQSVGAVAQEAEQATAALQKTGTTGQAAMAQVGDGAKKVEKQVGTLGKRAEAVGRKIGASMRRAMLGLAATIAAPLLGALAITNMVKTYTDGLKRLEELSKKRNRTMKEQKELKELLQKYTEKDIKQYREVTDAMEKLKAKAEKLAITLVRGLLTAFLKTADFLKEHWVAFIPLLVYGLVLLAKVLTSTVIPAVLKFTAALLTNPITWIVLALVALGVALEDLYTHLTGGEAAFGDFWESLGFGKGTMEDMKAAFKETIDDLKLAWSQLKTDVETVKNAFKKLGTALWDSPLVGGVIRQNIDLLSTAFSFIVDTLDGLWKLLTGDWSGAWESWQRAGATAIDFLMRKLTELKALFSAAKGDFETTLPNGEKLKGNVLEGMVSGMGALSIADQQAKAASGAAAGAGGPTTIDNSKNTDMGGVSITVNAPGTEPRAIASAVQGEVAKLVSNTNHGTVNP